MLILPRLRDEEETAETGGWRKIGEGERVTDKCVHIVYIWQITFFSSIMYETRKWLGMKNDCINCSIHWLPRTLSSSAPAFHREWSPTELTIHNAHTHSHIHANIELWVHRQNSVTVYHSNTKWCRFCMCVSACVCVCVFGYVLYK